MYLPIKDNDKPEQGADIGYALIKMINEKLDIEGRKFTLTFTKFDQPSNIKIIYDSEWCRIKFVFSRQQLTKHDELSIDYGRLHALDEQPYMEWQGQISRCWHNVIEPLRFLDGLSPFEAVEQAKTKKQSPDVVERFRHSERGQKLFNEYPPKASIVLQSVIWDHYGQQLFDLFDLRRPALWQDYRRFLKEFYRLLGMKSSLGPPYENVC